MITITDDMMSNALAILASDEHAKAKAAHEKTEREAKVLLARLGKEANECKTEAARSAFALCHPYYGDFIERQAAVAQAYYEARDRRDSAEAVTRAWQTLRADARKAESIR